MSTVVKKDDGALTEVISMRLSMEDCVLLEKVSTAVPAIPRLTLARLALRMGLDAIRQNPARALTPKGKKR